MLSNSTAIDCFHKFPPKECVGSLVNYMVCAFHKPQLIVIKNIQKMSKSKPNTLIFLEKKSDSMCTGFLVII